MRTITINSKSPSSKSFSLSLSPSLPCPTLLFLSLWLFGSHFPTKETVESQRLRLEKSTAFRTCFAYFTINPVSSATSNVYLKKEEKKLENTNRVTKEGK